MLQTRFHDTSRFKSEKFAEMHKEIFRVRYIGMSMVITDPDGKEETISLKFHPKNGLSPIDEEPLRVWLSENMKQRSKAFDEAIKELEERKQAHAVKMAKREKPKSNGNSKNTKKRSKKARS